LARIFVLNRQPCHKNHTWICYGHWTSGLQS
jgi:hypothetical protein